MGHTSIGIKRHDEFGEIDCRTGLGAEVGSRNLGVGLNPKSVQIGSKCRIRVVDSNGI